MSAAEDVRDPFAAYHRARRRRLGVAAVSTAAAATLAVALAAWVVVSAPPPAAASAAVSLSTPSPAPPTPGQAATPPATTRPGPHDAAAAAPAALVADPTAAQSAPAPSAPLPASPLQITVTATGYQAEVDKCQWVRMDIGAVAPIVAAHTGCGGAPVLKLQAGAEVRLTGQGVDGDYLVGDARDAHAGDDAATATAGMSAAVILQTCYPETGGRVRLVALLPID